MKSVFVLLLLVLSLSAFASKSYIVKLRDGSKMFSNKSFNGADIRPLNVSFGNFYVYTPRDGKNLLSTMKSNSDVLYVEPSRKYKIDPIETNKAMEPMFDSQWGLHNTGDNSGGWFGGGVAGKDVNALEAWKITKGNKEIKIAVIDTGVDYNHKDLKANMWVNEAELNGTKGVDDDNNGFVDDIHGYDFANKDGDPMDDNGHGTHCAGVIGAAHNGIGVAGVMSNVTIVGIKFLSGSGSGEEEDAVLSIDYAIKVGVDIMSNSWGGGDSSQILLDAIKAAKEHGILFVAAAGNSRRNNDTTDSFPANYKVDNVISVGSMDGYGKRSSFSNYGAKTVHVYAPGSGIQSTWKGGRYKKLSGTSMAAPFVSGVLGLMLSNERGLDYLLAKERLVESSVKSRNLDSSIAGGHIDAYRALKDIRN